MSYQVIARKWRPQAFEEVTGQDHITRTLRNAIEHDRLHHAYVFSGARGVGKTTTARLFAKALNCHKTDKPNPNPCKSGDADICPSCLEITESRSMDVLEFDAASNTQVEKIRDIILDGINVGAARDRYKMFIIDEVHMLSNSSFNALLKTVEEPPPNVVFIMATTELHKVPDTITSRSQEFVFRTIPQSQIFDRLRLIADAEKIDIDDAALQIIARSGEGSMRDAQSNFDQVISFSGDKIVVDDVAAALGLAGSDVIGKLIDSIASSKSKIALDIVAGLVDQGQDLRNFCRDVLAVLRDILIFKASGGEQSLVETSVLDVAELSAQAERFTEADLVRFFHSLADTESRLKDAVQSRFTLEVGLVKLIEMRRVTPIEDIIARLANIEGHSVEAPSEAKAMSVSADVSEKKTLTSEGPAAAPLQDAISPEPAIDVDEVPTWSDLPDELENDDTFDDSADIVVTEPEFVESGSAALPDLSFVASLPIRLPPISSEDLEHIEDRSLDDAFERKLEWSGDDLMPIRSASETLRRALGGEQSQGQNSNGSNGSGVATARQTYAYIPPAMDEEDIPLPELSADPTEKELLAYANAHPGVRRIMSTFRARVTSVVKKK